jgi:hypothetical protein
MKPRHASLLVLLTLLLSCSERTPTAPVAAVAAMSAAVFAGPSDIIHLSSAENYACGVKSEGTLVCWGSAGFDAPPPVGTFTLVTADVPCALTRGGSVLCWGPNYSGEAAAPPGRFTDLSGGPDYACGLRQNGTLACWGGNAFGQADAPDGLFTQVSAGAGLACAVAEDRSLLCWGLAFYGSPVPTGQFLQVDVGIDHGCAVRLDGTLACWGSNLEGQSSPPDGEFTQVAVGSFHSCALRQDGGVTCWGLDDKGQATAPAGTFTQLSAGFRFTCGLRDDAVAVCWGDIGTVEFPPVALPRSRLMGQGQVIDDAGTPIRFGFHVRVLPRHGSAPEGSVTFRADGDQGDFRNTRLHALSFDGDVARLTGRGWYRGRELDFVLSAVDGETATAGGVADGFRIQLWADEFNDYVYDSGPIDTPWHIVKPLVQGSIRFRLE